MPHTILQRMQPWRVAWALEGLGWRLQRQQKQGQGNMMPLELELDCNEGWKKLSGWPARGFRVWGFRVWQKMWGLDNFTWNLHLESFTWPFSFEARNIHLNSFIFHSLATFTWNWKHAVDIFLFKHSFGKSTLLKITWIILASLDLGKLQFYMWNIQLKYLHNIHLKHSLGTVFVF